MNSKKENRTAYKAMKFRQGIFQIKNQKDNRIFLQTCSDLDRAFNSDLFQLKANLHYNKILQNDWNTLGPDNFELSVLDELKIADTATPLEIRNDLAELLHIHKKELQEKGQLFY
jgi:hypothetical protein